MGSTGHGSGTTIDLPDPHRTGEMAVEAAIDRRRSRRQFGDGPLSLETVGQLLWAAQGITDPEGGYRAAPSAGATYPLELVLTVAEGGVDDLQAGIYRYRQDAHALVTVAEGDPQPALREAALDQAWIEQARANIVVAGVDDRTTRQYADRGAKRYVPMEAGHAGQNIYLQATALDLGTVAVGAFDDAAVSRIVHLDETERPLYIYPVGPLAQES